MERRRFARLLENHPSVSFSNVKEPHFFSWVDLNDLDDDALRETVAGQYLGRYFSKIDPRSSVMAEASVSYLYAPERLLPLLRLWPDAKFIIAARDPLELIPSSSPPAPALPGRRNGDQRREGLETDRGTAGTGERCRRTCLRFPPVAVRRSGQPRQTHQSVLRVFLGRERCEVVLFDDLKWTSKSCTTGAGISSNSRRLRFRSGSIAPGMASGSAGRSAS